MIQVKQIIDGKWNYNSYATLKVGDTVEFSCNGKGRGGHYRVSAIVTKVNKKTFDAIEKDGSYRPGTVWNVQSAKEGLVIVI